MTPGEKSVLNKMFKILKNYEWEPSFVFDGEEQIPVKNKKQAIDIIDSVDSSTVTFSKQNNMNMGVFIVLGNDPSGIEVAADWNVSDKNDFDKAMEEFTDNVWGE